MEQASYVDKERRCQRKQKLSAGNGSELLKKDLRVRQARFSTEMSVMRIGFCYRCGMREDFKYIGHTNAQSAANGT